MKVISLTEKQHNALRNVLAMYIENSDTDQSDEPNTNEAEILRLILNELESDVANLAVHNYIFAPDDRVPCCWDCTPDYRGMLLCSTCGNKRCPHASNHLNGCTGSNQPGQVGSVY